MENILPIFDTWRIFFRGELENGVFNIGWGFVKFNEGKLCNIKSNILKLISFNTCLTGK